MSFNERIAKCMGKVRVYNLYQTGKFDQEDRKRIKPLTRLRQSEEEHEQARNGNLKRRVKDWYDDIDRGYSK